MKKILFLFILFTQTTFSQNDVILKINHLMGNYILNVNSLGTNNLSQNFKLDRVQYYISEISIIHDNNQTTNIIDTWLMIDGLLNTEINLGSYDIDSVESFHFSIGVDSAHNHLDPSTFISSHALAPKSPSMHWGWTSGYRFVCVEGNTTGGNTFHCHSFGDNLYFSQSLDYTKTGAKDNTVTIQINANYIEAVKDLDVISSYNVHDNENDSITSKTIDNFRNHVFYAYEGNEDFIEPTSISDLKNTSLILYPNPTSGNISFKGLAFDSAIIYNAIGEKIKTLSNNTTQTYLNEKGVYFIHLITNSKTIAVKKILVY